MVKSISIFVFEEFLFSFRLNVFIKCCWINEGYFRIPLLMYTFNAPVLECCLEMLLIVQRTEGTLARILLVLGLGIIAEGSLLSVAKMV